ncbi:MAG: type II secretion system protein GspE [Candidatus Omnitrophica bacterium CG_4_9_14_0_2_um_filter_42_8]|nr:MAG: type II secretion system protein GspE [Candidatus Omnitrophica bacterium CG22_combo_CG10-13_8_21_14_all_43_16]PJC47005.1 MAG: type II secretion system protein GspE [Candidatus Omnitrophica bacterium CG_4_9_14_0_2_um_filter_42_8]
MTKKSIEQILFEKAVITKEQLDKAMEESKKKGMSVGKVIVRSGMATEEAYAQAASEALDVPYVNLESYIIDTEVIKLIPEAMAQKYKAVPIFKIRDILTVAMVDPKDIVAIDDLSRKAKCDIEAMLSTESAIANAIEQYYGTSSSFDDVVKDIDKENRFKSAGAEFDSTKLAEIAEEAPVIKLVNMIIMQAVKDKASDIHIEPEETRLAVRFRIDGILHEMFSPPKHLEPALMSRIKVLSKMDIAEKRKPQDGRFNMKAMDRDIDLRVSSFPTIYGENIVIRILDRGSILMGLDKVGFTGETQKEFEKFIKYPHGIILVTGPTGSGKTTTLYSALSTIDSEEKNVITIEDPVEYHLGRIRQSQVNPKAGLTFAAGLRSILRQDPDIIMVGEIRDKETAEISVQAALTGHLVFSTLHTNDAAGALSRLIDMGIEPFLISSSMLGILAQRLVRKICDKCKEEYIPSEDILKGLGVGQKKGFFKGKGCSVCKNTGYSGRIGIFELLIVNDKIRKLIVDKASSDVIKKTAIETGMKTLRDDGLDKVLKGITTPEEVIKATQEE